MMKRYRGSTILMTAIMAILAIAYLFPVLWLLLSSFKPGSELFSFPLKLFPEEFTLDNYKYAWSTMEFTKYVLNTSFVTIVATLLTIMASASCGYALAKYKYKWLSVFFICILATTMLPTEVIMNPTFTVIQKVGLYDNLWGLIIPSINTATGIFMFRQFFMTVPDDLLEAARIDGANEGRIFFRLMLPIAKPIIITLAIFSFQWRWNDYIWPLIVISDPNKYTIQVAIRSIVGADNIDWVLLLSASVISLLPMVLLYAIFQRYIMDTGASSGLKD
ncbi:carbohydrate ABC transporter permease [Rossellomorea marisflavi]|jgi:alpha-1,4-digalacturonate transport system permease protein|uniref:Carbohydrate ABC transporter permease n=2 Tax=Bacillaceae TaxID=186817 RepID=A0A0J5V6N7_9BACI|nr:carbohydrate ABC transporter permease [Rossellomorea marisflavi]KQU57137.1 sugar ABC transporter permease [Bacillus sp. Leaf406]VXA97048.1 Sugar ABC transporter permease [Bacillus sp. 349Y]KML01820.1 sugar ABC transporter permease [Rossellomorea marisflavi]KML33517.1 sugar ABC transporter permease [Rossellomorea marisflavi]KON90597.1 sugar ABC transporter permease [Rossellomorea marisflavi]